MTAGIRSILCLMGAWMALSCVALGGDTDRSDVFATFERRQYFFQLNGIPTEKIVARARRILNRAELPPEATESVLAELRAKQENLPAGQYHDIWLGIQGTCKPGREEFPDWKWRSEVQIAPAADHTADLSPEMKTILSRDTGVRYADRIQAVHHLSDLLMPKECDRLLDFLDESYGADWAFLTPLEFNAVRNDIVLTLLAQRHDPPLEAVAQRLMQVLSENEEDEVWLNYSVHFLGQLALRMEGRERARIVDALWRQCQSDGVILGTSLLALSDIAMTCPDMVDLPRFLERAVAVAATPSMPEPARTAAVQAGQRLRCQAMAPVCRKLACSREIPLSLRISAIATLGILANAEDRSLLESLANSSDIGIKHAAASALRQLSSQGQEKR